MNRQVRVGDVLIGGGADVSIQSMSNIDTRNVKAVLEQIHILADAGCQIMRLAVPTMEVAEAFGEIKKKSVLPLVADIHFDHRLAIEAMKNGADKIRINPGNIGTVEDVGKELLKWQKKEIYLLELVLIQALQKDILEREGMVNAKGLAESAMRSVKKS